MKHLGELYPAGYFSDRLQNDPLRIRAFLQDGDFMADYIQFDGRCLDVGCGTGEFLETIGWQGDRVGIEISRHAADEARRRGFQIVRSGEQLEAFDAIVYRGTLQHLDSPFRSLAKAFKSLRPGGYLFILATPNIESITYCLLKNLPALDASRNFYLPGHSNVVNICEGIGFVLTSSQFPYWASPYRKITSDHLKFVSKFVGKCFGSEVKVDFAFWGNMMNLVFRRPL